VGRPAPHFERKKKGEGMIKEGRAIWPFPMKKKKDNNNKRQCLFFSQNREKERRERKDGETFLIFAIYEDLTVRSSIRLRKRDPCTWIYVSTDRFKVKH
jgi:hypothetical protein